MSNQSEFICDYCSRSFTRKYNLQNHIDNLHLSSTCTCDVCHQKFGTAAGFQLHMNRGHNRKGQPFPECDLCGRIFSRRQNIVSHMSTVHLQSPATDFQCNLCLKYFTTEWSLKRHAHQIHNPNNPSCSICKKVFKRQDGLNSHIQTCHKRGSDLKQCSICKKSYANNRNLKRHIETSHSYANKQYPKIIGTRDIEESNVTMNLPESDSDSDEPCEDNDNTCTLCDERFNAEDKLRQHVKTQHSFKAFYKYCRNTLIKQDKYLDHSQPNVDGISCCFCNAVSTDLTDYANHMREKHGKDVKLTCNVCYKQFDSNELLEAHKNMCIVPNNVYRCSHCEKLFTVKCSLDFHLKVFHPQMQIADSNITSTNNSDVSESNPYKCQFCERMYNSDKSLKHHLKLKHSTDEVMKCGICGKLYNNKYYYAMHMKVVHNNDTLLKCDYCDKTFTSKRNIRRHIEFTHLGLQRYKCIECVTLFKEKRSLRKHVRSKHANSALFPKCDICNKRFESAKSCMIHQKLLHSVVTTSHPCHLCSITFDSQSALKSHLKLLHLAEEELYKCNECSLVFKGHDNFEQHSECHYGTSSKQIKQMPRCAICIKDFSTRKTLKRHIKKFHSEFDLFELIDFAKRKGDFRVDCEDCLRKFNDEQYLKVYQLVKNNSNAIVFKCEFCSATYNPLEYGIQRCKLGNSSIKSDNTIMSELCTAEMSAEDDSSELSNLQEIMEPESTTVDVKIEPMEDLIMEKEIKIEPAY